MSEENVARFIAATEAFNRLAAEVQKFDEQALSEWLDFMDAEIRFEPQQAALQGTYEGQAGAAQWLADLAEHYESGQVRYTEIRDLGSRVLGLGAIHVVGRGSGIATDVPAAVLMTFRGGLITRLQDFGGDKAQALEAAELSE
jgi:ketosteroid isomerase-like protein